MFETSASVNDKINFAPSSTVDEVQQNLVTLLTTAAGSVPLNRGLGLDMTAIDQPMEVASALVAAAAIDAIDTYEPRAVVKSVTTTFDGDGRLVPVVKWELVEEVST